MLQVVQHQQQQVQPQRTGALPCQCPVAVSQVCQTLA